MNVRGWPLLLGSLFIVLPPVARWYFFSDGEIYGASRSNYVNAIIAVLAVAGALMVYRAFSSNAPAPHGVELLAGLVAVATAAFALAQFLFPETPRNAAAPACGNASVEGASILAQTTEQGVNTRAGAGRQYAQVGRFPADCTVGFDGYCVGEPLPDLLLAPNSPDSRWLIVHRKRELVPAAFMVFQGGEAALGQPDESCDEYGGTPAGSIDGITVEVIPGGLTVRATGAGVAFVGYAAVELGKGAEKYVRIGQSDAAGTQFAVPWIFAEADPFSEGLTGSAWVAATHCLAGNAPAPGAPRILRVDLHGGVLIQDPQVVTEGIPSDITEKLSHMSCSRPVAEG